MLEKEKNLEELQQTIESLQASLNDTAAELSAAKREYREYKTAHLQELYEARRETEAAIREEIRSLSGSGISLAAANVVQNFPRLRTTSFRF